LVAAVTAAVVLALALIIPLALRDERGGDRPQGAGQLTAGAPGSTAGAPGPATGASTDPSAGTPPATPGQSATPGTQPGTAPSGPSYGDGSAGGNKPPLQAGWRMYKDSTGFSVPVPPNWRIEREWNGESYRVYFREPTGARRLLMIDQTRQPRPDPVKDWKDQEAARIRSNMYQNYDRIKIESVKYWLKAADWDWRHTSGGVRLHVRNRGFVTANDQAYAIYWSTPDSAWNDSLDEFEMIAAHFKPARSDPSLGSS
jgi:hypothetical protein